MFDPVSLETEAVFSCADASGALVLMAVVPDKLDKKKSPQYPTLRVIEISSGKGKDLALHERAKGRDDETTALYRGDKVKQILADPRNRELWYVLIRFGRSEGELWRVSIDGNYEVLHRSVHNPSFMACNDVGVLHLLTDEGVYSINDKVSQRPLALAYQEIGGFLFAKNVDGFVAIMSAHVDQREFLSREAQNAYLVSIAKSAHMVLPTRSSSTQLSSPCVPTTRPAAGRE
ncbi:MAG: hypothetical protein IPK83_19385 [Planctomycetes bacterium]|nr:hypothetical protein [Planctomycetota bacterium]